MKIRIFFPICLIILASCSSKKDSKVVIYNLTRSDYIEKINIPGTVQAVNITPVMSPQSRFGQMTVQKLAKDGSYVKKGDTLCVLIAGELEAIYKEALRSIEKLEAEYQKSIAQNKLNIANLENELWNCESRLNIAMLDSLKIKFETRANQELLGLKMKKASIEKQKIQKRLASAKKIADTDIRQKQMRITQEKMRVKTYADQIASMTIIAPREGIVMRTDAPRMMFFSTMGSGSFGGPVREGSTITSNTALLQFPDLSKMLISADASESDFKRIEKGQKVLINIDAAKKITTTGKVNRKSLATSAGQRYSGSKVRTFEVIIDIDSCDSRLSPGLSAGCEIILRELRDTLFIPSMAVFEKDTVKVVYVRNNDLFRVVTIETGLSGSSYTLISQGLNGNETIALSRPPERMIEQPAKIITQVSLIKK